MTVTSVEVSTKTRIERVADAPASRWINSSTTTILPVCMFAYGSAVGAGCDA